MERSGVTSSKRASTPAWASVPAEILVLIADLAQLFIMGLLLDLLLFDRDELAGAIRLAVVAAVLVGVLKSHGWIVLFALQASLFIREPRRPEMVFSLVPWLYVLTSLCLIAYAYLGKPFRKRVSRWIALQTLTVMGIDDRNESESSEPASSSSNWMRFLAIQFSILAVITLVAMLALLRLPITDGARSQWFRSAIENDYTVWPGASLLVLALLLVIVFMEAGWRQMTGPQAKLYLRSSFVLDHYLDLKLIVMRRLKRNRAPSAVVPQRQLVERGADTPPKL